MKKICIQYLTQGWFPKTYISNNENSKDNNSDSKIYDISLPSLTYKEICAINQLLDHNTSDIESSVKKVQDEFPFIPKNTIKKYIEIWEYYPRYLEVDSFI